MWQSKLGSHLWKAAGALEFDMCRSKCSISPLLSMKTEYIELLCLKWCNVILLVSRCCDMMHHEHQKFIDSQILDTYLGSRQGIYQPKDTKVGEIKPEDEDLRWFGKGQKLLGASGCSRNALVLSWALGKARQWTSPH